MRKLLDLNLLPKFFAAELGRGDVNFNFRAAAPLRRGGRVKMRPFPIAPLVF
jgi:hypothetical protein